MSDYQHSVHILAPAQDVYEFVSNTENFPKFLPTLGSATPEEGGKIEMQGTVEGHGYQTEGEFHLDPDERTMHWGSDSHEYRGQLQVTGDDSASQLSAKLCFTTDSETEEKIKQRSGDSETPIQDALIHALDNVKRQCEAAAVAKPREDHGYLG
jgi:uncharacterized protein YndB with AHSA1/START domain